MRQQEYLQRTFKVQRIKGVDHQGKKKEGKKKNGRVKKAAGALWEVIEPVLDAPYMSRDAYHVTPSRYLFKKDEEKKVGEHWADCPKEAFTETQTTNMP